MTRKEFEDMLKGDAVNALDEKTCRELVGNLLLPEGDPE